MALNEGQVITYMVDEVIETVENLTPMAQRVGKYTPPAVDMQRSQNTVWMPLEQEAPTMPGWDLTGQATGILELSVKCNMGVPDNDFFTLRADDLRDERSLRRRTQASGKKLANNVESAIAKQAAEMGSLAVTSPNPIGSSTTGWDFISEAEELIFSRELNRNSGLSFFFNGKDYRGAGQDLTGKTSMAASRKMLIRVEQSRSRLLALTMCCAPRKCRHWSLLPQLALLYPARRSSSRRRGWLIPTVTVKTWITEWQLLFCLPQLASSVVTKSALLALSSCRRWLRTY